MKAGRILVALLFLIGVVGSLISRAGRLYRACCT